MADVFDKKKRSEVMSRIRSKNTLIERSVFAFLRHNKVYFKRHYNKVPGKPDLALPRKKIAVFIDGDFWHGRDYAKRKSRLPPYWQEKIANNIKRDRKNRMILRKSGWRVLRVWERDIKKHPARTFTKILDFLANQE
jgi:DNA mismatch endonuclease, patch repair protein